MLRVLNICCLLHVAAFFLVSCQLAADERFAARTYTISGTVRHHQRDVADVPVCLCDGKTGKPLVLPAYAAMTFDGGLPAAPAIVQTDADGQFQFTGVPPGQYRVIAQKWTGPWKGLFEVHGTVIELFGSSAPIPIPPPEGLPQQALVLTPPGEGIIQFDQQTNNDDTLLLLSASRPAFDPILGFHSLDSEFWLNLQGMNRMPRGRTTVIGAPDVPLYAFFFAADNSPGFALASIPPSGGELVRQEAEPFIAGWSNGRKTMPIPLQNLSEFLSRKQLSIDALLSIPDRTQDGGRPYAERIQQLTRQLTRRIALPEDRVVRVGDLLAIEAWRRLDAQASQ